MSNIDVSVVKTTVTAKSRKLKGTWTINYDVNSMYATGINTFGKYFKPTHISVAKNKKGVTIHLNSKDAKDLVFEQTGQHYSTINLKTDDPLYTFLTMKYENNNEVQLDD